MSVFLKQLQTPDRVLFALAIMVTIALQVQVTLGANESYTGLRISLADLILPFAGLYIAGSLLMKHSIWPAWRTPYMWWGLLALLAALTLGLFQGYHTNGFWSPWALFNKYSGFYVLVAYCALGGWIASNVRDQQKLFQYIMNACCLFFSLIVLVSFGAIFYYTLGNKAPWIGIYPWDGLMANRNSFAFMGLMALLFWENNKGGRARSFWWYALFLTLLPAFAFFNASRTAWIVGAVILSLSCIRKPLKETLHKSLFILLGIILLNSTLYLKKTEHFDHKGDEFSKLIDVIENPMNPLYNGDQKRLIALEDGLELYRNSPPLLGSGLGSFRPFQMEKRGKFIDIIDFTALWILTEMGLVGLIAFAGFFLMCLWQLYKARGSDFHRSLFFFMLAFAFMSCLHELTYMRFVWFFLGVAMVSCPSAKDKTHYSG